MHFELETARTKDGMILTNDGKKFYKLATKIISSIHEAISELKSSHKKCIVNIGFCPSIMIFDLIEQLRYANFKMDCIRFHEFNAKRQLIALKNNHIDISITRGADTASSEGLEQIILHKAELFAVIPAAHRLSGKKMLDLDDLKDDPFVVLSERFFPFYSKTVTAMCKKCRIHPSLGFLCQWIRCRTGNHCSRIMRGDFSTRHRQFNHTRILIYPHTFHRQLH